MAYLRRLPKFEYAAPATLAEVTAFTAGAAEEEILLLAGGTDAILQMRRRERTPKIVVGLKGVAGLAGVGEDGAGGLVIGATTTLDALTTQPLIRKRYGLLAEAAAQIGGVELRNVATIGGNVAGALPCADLPPALMALGAKVKLASQWGERWLALDAFYPEFARTNADKGEVVAAIGLPKPAAHGAGSYLKFHDRHSMDMTVVGVAAFVTWDPAKNAIAELRLAYANSAPTVMRARQAEAVLRGQAPTDDALAACAEEACRETKPRTSWRANGAYRLELIRALTKRAVASACAKAQARLGDAP
jgi:CO/xanthine dehydrogenase FAD-binding subunit